MIIHTLMPIIKNPEAVLRGSQPNICGVKRADASDMRHFICRQCSWPSVALNRFSIRNDETPGSWGCQVHLQGQFQNVGGPHLLVWPSCQCLRAEQFRVLKKSCRVCVCNLGKVFTNHRRSILPLLCTPFQLDTATPPWQKEHWDPQLWDNLLKVEW